MALSSPNAPAQREPPLEMPTQDECIVSDAGSSCFGEPERGGDFGAFSGATMLGQDPTCRWLTSGEISRLSITTAGQGQGLLVMRPAEVRAALLPLLETVDHGHDDHRPPAPHLTELALAVLYAYLLL